MVASGKYICQYRGCLINAKSGKWHCGSAARTIGHHHAENNNTLHYVKRLYQAQIITINFNSLPEFQQLEIEAG